MVQRVHYSATVLLSGFIFVRVSEGGDCPSLFALGTPRQKWDGRPKMLQLSLEQE